MRPSRPIRPAHLQQFGSIWILKSLECKPLPPFSLSIRHWNMGADQPANRPRFVTTHWSLVGRAGRETPRRDAAGDARPELGELLGMYLTPLRKHLVHKKGLRPEDADDVLNGFVADKILDRAFLANADRSKGRFRSLILTALDRYLISLHRHIKGKRRSPPSPLLDLDEQPDVAGNGATAGDIFDLSWARQVVRQALEQMEAECQGNGQQALWGLFDARIVAPNVRQERPLAYKLIVARFGFESSSQAKEALLVAERMYKRCLWAVLAKYAAADEIDAEIADLHRILAGASD